MFKNSYCETEKITCHAERRIDLRVSASHDTEIPNQVLNDMNPSPQPSPTRGEGVVSLSQRERVNSRVDFSLPEKLDCRASLAMTNKNPTTANATLTPHPDPLPQGARERRCAFTLAEVLITLGIIGIVAAMTLPTLIQKHQEHVTVNKVKKFYSVMSQAQLLAIKDHGYLDEWDVPDGMTKESAEKLMSYLKPYLKIAKDCGTESRCLQNGTVKLLNGDNWANYDYSNDNYKLILNDGTYMWLRSSNGVYCATYDGEVSNTCGVLWIDINGKNPPNTIAKDIFLFALVKNGIVTFGNDDCNSSSYGSSCSKYILEQGNMDYLKK